MKACLTTPRTAILAMAVVLAAPTWAQSNLVKLGVTRYDTHSTTNGVTGIGIPPGADARTGDATTLAFVYERILGPRLGVELVLGVPPRIKAKATGSVAFLGEVLSARNVAPSLLVNYRFGEPGDKLRAYVGGGINYTRFVNVSTPYGWDVELKDSIGPQAHAGVEYQLTKPWAFWASISFVKVKSDLVAVGNSVLQTTIDFRPTIFTAGLSYAF